MANPHPQPPQYVSSAQKPGKKVATACTPSSTLKTRQQKLIQGWWPLEEGSINLFGKHRPGKVQGDAAPASEKTGRKAATTLKARQEVATTLKARQESGHHMQAKQESSHHTPGKKK